MILPICNCAMVLGALTDAVSEPGPAMRSLVSDAKKPFNDLSEMKSQAASCSPSYGAGHACSTRQVRVASNIVGLGIGAVVLLHCLTCTWLLGGNWLLLGAIE